MNLLQVLPQSRLRVNAAANSSSDTNLKFREVVQDGHGSFKMATADMWERVMVRTAGIMENHVCSRATLPWMCC